MLPFPAGIPLPHQARNWGQSLLSEAADQDLTDPLHGRIPPGKFEALYPASTLAPFEAPDRAASYTTHLKWREFEDRRLKRIKDNERLKAQRNSWWSSSSTKVFHLIVDSMITTNPSLRETLKEKFEVSEGVYDGPATYVAVQAWLQDMHEKHPQCGI